MAHDGAAVYRAAFLEALRPDALLTVTEWADEHRYLSPKGAAEPGRYRSSRVPYLTEILDNLSKDSPVQEVVLMKAAQIGATEAGLNVVGYVVHHAPAPILMVLPTESLAERTSKQRIAPMIEVTPVLRDRIKEARSRDSGNTLMMKEFPNGYLILAGANSGAGLRSMPAKVVIMDEVDAYPADVDGEGSPIELAKKRTNTFPRRKLFYLSTPLDKHTSIIEAEFETTDQRYYHVPCPFCDHAQILRWANVKWDKKDDGRPDLKTVRYECESCGGAIKNHQKTGMLSRGQWIATAPANADPKRVGYHLSALYSPVGWYSWEEAVSDWHKAQADTQKLKTFINTVLGETFEVKGEDTPDWRRLYERREPYTIGIVPMEASLLTAAIDVQKDRLEMSVFAWARKEAWLVEHIVLPGDTAGEVVWKDAAVLIDRDWLHASGRSLKLQMTLVDSGFNTQHVYDFVRTQDPRRVRAIKGQETLSVAVGGPSLLDYTFKGKRYRHGVRLWPVGTNHLKGDLYARLKQPMPTADEMKLTGFPPNFVHFPMVAEDYFQQLVAEKLVLHTNKATQKSRYVWVKVNPRNEALDLACYNLAAWHALGCARWTDQQWARTAQEAGARRETVPTPAPTETPAAAAPAKPTPPTPPRPTPRRDRPVRRSSFW